jgi:hypothetical protein
MALSIWCIMKSIVGTPASVHGLKAVGVAFFRIDELGASDRSI